MAISKVLSRHVATLLVVFLIIGVCTSHTTKHLGMRRKYKGLSRCILSRAYPCFTPGFQVRCFYRYQMCDGTRHCPWGDDEFYCNDKITPTRTRYVTITKEMSKVITSTGRAFFTIFTTTESTISTTTTTTTTSAYTTTATALRTTTRSLEAVVSFPGEISVVTAVLTVITTIDALRLIGADNIISAGTPFCDNLVVVLGESTLLRDDIFSADFVGLPLTTVATASFACMPSTTVFQLV